MIVLCRVVSYAKVGKMAGPEGCGDCLNQQKIFPQDQGVFLPEVTLCESLMKEKEQNVRIS